MKPLAYSILWGLLLLIIAFTLVLAYECVFGESIPTYDCTLTDIDSQTYDGDTLKDVRVLIHPYDFLLTEYGNPWPGIHITARGIEVETDIRIAGIDTPEKRVSTKHADGRPRSVASRMREKDAALSARQALIDILATNDGRFTIDTPLHGKYAGRTVANVSVLEVDVASILIENGHAKVYNGGRKPDWKWGD